MRAPTMLPHVFTDPETGAAAYRTVFGVYVPYKLLARASELIYVFVTILAIRFAYKGFLAAMPGEWWVWCLLGGVVVAGLPVIIKLIQFNQPTFGKRQLVISVASVLLACLFDFFGVYTLNGLERAVEAERQEVSSTVNTFATVARREVGAAVSVAARERDEAVAAANAKATEELARFERRKLLVASQQSATASHTASSVDGTDEMLKVNKARVVSEKDDAIAAAEVKYGAVMARLDKATAYLDELVAYQNGGDDGVATDDGTPKSKVSIADEAMTAPDFAALSVVARRANGLMQAANGEYQAAKTGVSLDPQVIKVEGDHLFNLAVRGLKEWDWVAIVSALIAFLLEGIDILVVFLMRSREEYDILAENGRLRTRVGELEAAAAPTP